VAPAYLEQRETPHTLADLSRHDRLAYSEDNIESRLQGALAAARDRLSELACRERRPFPQQPLAR
jgi:hypothetical protein